MITPAISVLSAVEEVKVAVPGLASLVIPITIAVLAAPLRSSALVPMLWADSLDR